VVFGVDWLARAEARAGDAAPAEGEVTGFSVDLDALTALEAGGEGPLAEPALSA
jgi:hypothetical protein